MVKKKNPIDIILEAKSALDNKPIEDIKIKDLRKSNKKEIKNPSILDNSEGFCVEKGELKIINFGDIKNKKGRIKEKETLEQWGPADFFEFAHKLYQERYSTYWDLVRGGNYLLINKIKDSLYNYFGFCCNLILKDYIIFYFENKADYFSQNGKNFYLDKLLDNNVIADFIRTYNFEERFREYKKENFDKKEKNILEKELKKSYDMGDTSLVGNYGIVISLNWLLNFKEKKEAVDIVVDACKKMYKRDSLDMVIKATEFYSPYPDDIVFKKPELVLKKVLKNSNKNVNLNVEFKNVDKYVFLRKVKKEGNSNG